MRSFYVIVASSASKDIFPENTLQEFSNQLPQEIDVTNYKVALQSIFLDNKYGNIPNSILGTRNHFLMFPSTDFMKEPLGVYNITDFTLSPNKFATEASSQLNRQNHRVLVMVIQKKIQIVTTNCVLLVHKQINRYLQFSSQKQKYLGEDYFVLNSEGATHTFISTEAFPTEIITPTVIKVQLEEMQQHVGEVELVQDLAVIKVKDVTYPFFNVCKRKEYMKLRCNRLTSLSVRLVDQENFPIHVGIGQATLVKLQFKTFPMKSFVLRLSSLESNNIFSDNSSSSFRIQLRHPIETLHNWEVALSSIYLPNKISVTSVFLPTNFYIDISANGQTFQRMSLHDVTDFSPEGFVTLCTSKLARMFAQSPPPIEIVTREKGELYVRFQENTVLRISGMLAYILSKAPTPDLQEFWVMEGEKKAIEQLGKLNFARAQPHVVLLHCNFITPIVVGNTFGQVLQVIPYYDTAANVSGNLMKYEAQHMDFLPMSMNDRAMLQFEIRNVLGELISFQNKNAELLITLVFREII
jgi:hypothetical protein